MHHQGYRKKPPNMWQIQNGKFKLNTHQFQLSSIRVVGKDSWTKQEEFYVGKFKLESTGHTTVLGKFLPKLEFFSRS